MAKEYSCRWVPIPLEELAPAENLKRPLILRRGSTFGYRPWGGDRKRKPWFCSTDGEGYFYLRRDGEDPFKFPREAPEYYRKRLTKTSLPSLVGILMGHSEETPYNSGESWDIVYYKLESDIPNVVMPNKVIISHPSYVYDSTYRKGCTSIDYMYNNELRVRFATDDYYPLIPREFKVFKATMKEVNYVHGYTLPKKEELTRFSYPKKS